MATSFEARYPGTPLGVRALRRELAAVAEDCGMEADAMDDLRIAVTEAATNAVMHGYNGSDGGLHVRADLDDGELVVVVADIGRGIEAGRPSPGAGFGLPLIARLTSRFHVRSGRGGTEVHMAFPCPAG